MVDYSRFNDIGDSSDDDDQPVLDSTPAADCSRRLLTAWLKEAAPAVSDDEINFLVKFIEVQQPIPGQPDNRARAVHITAFLEKQRTPPRTAPLVSAVAMAQTRNFDVLEASERGPATRASAAMISALNTLCACKELFGPRKLFDLMREYPDADVAMRYTKMAYAAAALDAFSEARLRAAAGPQQRSALPKLRAPATRSSSEGHARPAVQCEASSSADAGSDATPPKSRRPWRKWEVVGILVALINVLLILLALFFTGAARLYVKYRDHVESLANVSATPAALVAPIPGSALAGLPDDEREL